MCLCTSVWLQRLLRGVPSTAAEHQHAVRYSPAPLQTATTTTITTTNKHNKPAWACGEQRDYFANVTLACADASCNAARRNLGGSVLVLDTKSYGTKGCQGCNPEVPATCCQACKDTDGCNAWTVCTRKGGCGSGCAAYAKRFKAPLEYGARLPHAFWGNWGGCDGDRWPHGVCTLRVVSDTANPPVTSSGEFDDRGREGKSIGVADALGRTPLWHDSKSNQHNPILNPTQFNLPTKQQQHQQTPPRAGSAASCPRRAPTRAARRR